MCCCSVLATSWAQLILDASYAWTEKPYGIGEHLVDVGVHGYTLVVGRGLPSVPVAERLKCVVNQLQRVALLGGAIRISFFFFPCECQ